MLTWSIPGRELLTIAHLVLDFNGTLACDGQLLPDVAELLYRLRDSVTIHVVTADTFGSVHEQVSSLGCTLVRLEPGDQAAQKLRYVERLGVGQVVAIGNGANDVLMLRAAALGIALIQAEGAATATLLAADVVCRSIDDALLLLLQPQRLTATLRV